MSETRVIKKYPNRRLYDTVESRYITLADIRRLVVEKVEFVVVDKKTQEDITRTILLQVIAEQEHRTDPLLSREFLSQVIRSYGGPTQPVIGAYLEHSLKLISQQQRELRERLKAQGTGDANDLAAGLAERGACAGAACRTRSCACCPTRAPPAPAVKRARATFASKHKRRVRARCSRRVRISTTSARCRGRWSSAADELPRCAVQAAPAPWLSRRRCAWTGAHGPDDRPRAPSRARRRLRSACR